ncbi:MAG: GFA family protein [Novosphingobium sp.]|nr:GFA family protein [Novosphingobium sp.]
MVEGGCNCGAVRYRIEGDPMVVAQCHCRNCQRQSGSAFSVNLLVQDANFATTGDLTTYVDKDTLSGAPILRKFCGICGSPILSDFSNGTGMVVVKAGTLDDPTPFTPGVSVWTSRKLPWVDLPDEQHKFERNA